jgi:NADH:ubiquinone oxidoreductase subunit C
MLLTGGRLLSIVYTPRGIADDVSLKYLFMTDGGVQCVEIRVHMKSTVQSISSLCGAAIYYENEIRDMTGIYFEGLEQDYGRRFILSGEVIESAVDIDE